MMSLILSGIGITIGNEVPRRSDALARSARKRSGGRSAGARWGTIGGVVVIRRAAPVDAVSAAEIIAAALGEFGVSFEAEGRDGDVRLVGAREDHDDFVAEVEGRAVGIACVGPQGEPGAAWVSKVFVERAARGRGVGRALMEAVEAAARARGYRRIGLRTRVVFADAIRLYERLGYLRADVEEGRLERGDVVYFRDL